MPVSDRLTRSLFNYATAFALDTLINNWHPLPQTIYDFRSNKSLTIYITGVHYSSMVITGSSLMQFDILQFIGYKQA